MKNLLYILTIIFLTSCSYTGGKKTDESQVDTVSQVDTTLHKDTISQVDTIPKAALSADEHDESNEIPPNGKYRFDIAFAEWQGKSMGEKVTVVINDGSIKVIYEGDGKLTQIKKGDIIDEGKIMKHKTGVWIIGKNPSDAQLDEISGCTGGPAIIDFKEKKYWFC